MLFSQTTTKVKKVHAPSYANLSAGVKKKVVKKAILGAAREQEKVYRAFESKYGRIPGIAV